MIFDVDAWVKGEDSTSFIVKASSHSEAKSKARKRVREDECIDSDKLKGAKWFCKLAAFDDNGVLVG